MWLASGARALWLQVGVAGGWAAATVLTLCVVPPRPGQRFISCSDGLARPHWVWKIGLVRRACCSVPSGEEGEEGEVWICQGQPFMVSEGTEVSEPPGAPLPLRLIPVR